MTITIPWGVNSVNDAIGLILSLISLLGAIGAVGRWVLQVRKEQRQSRERSEERHKQLEDTLNEIGKAAYTAVIMNENVPLSERVCAGEKYIAIGGNGKIKEAVIVLSRAMNEELSARLEMENYNREV